MIRVLFHYNTFLKQTQTEIFVIFSTFGTLLFCSTNVLRLTKTTGRDEYNVKAAVDRMIRGCFALFNKLEFTYCNTPQLLHR